MFGRRKKALSVFDEPIERILSDMNVYGPDSPEYPKLVESLERLAALRQKDIHPLSKASPDTLLLVMGNLIGILIIVAYEQKHVMASKATGFVLKTGSRT